MPRTVNQSTAGYPKAATKTSPKARAKAREAEALLDEDDERSEALYRQEALASLPFQGRSSSGTLASDYGFDY